MRNVFLAEEKSLASDAFLSFKVSTSPVPDPAFVLWRLVWALSKLKFLSCPPQPNISMNGSHNLIESRFSKRAGDVQSRTITRLVSGEDLSSDSVGGWGRSPELECWTLLSPYLSHLSNRKSTLTFPPWLFLHQETPASQCTTASFLQSNIQHPQSPGLRCWPQDRLQARVTSWSSIMGAWLSFHIREQGSTSWLLLESIRGMMC